MSQNSPHKNLRACSGEQTKENVPMNIGTERCSSQDIASCFADACLVGCMHIVFISMEFTFEELSDIHLRYGKMLCNATAACYKYAEKFPNRRMPSIPTFIAMLVKQDHWAQTIMPQVDCMQ
jgi:hypothetical protein